MLKKNMVVGLILLFVVIASTPAVIGIQEKTYNTPSSEVNRAEWKTNYYCRINVVLDAGDGEPELGILFIRHAESRGPVSRCRIGGDIIEKGKFIEISVDYLFGYAYLRWMSWLSNYYMRGFALKCTYRILDVNSEI